MRWFLLGVFFLLLWAGVSIPTPVHAHGGGLDANGCHHNRKTGDYHCHRGPSVNLAGSRASTSGATSRGGVFRNCAAARAAGAAPVREGDPGYGRHLDRDGDGVGCE